MRVHWPSIVLLAILTCAWANTGLEAADLDDRQPPNPSVAETDSGQSRVSVIEPRSGEPILVVNYPWHRHARPSVEVRMFADGERDSRQIRPLYFVDEFMKGKVTIGVYQCQDRSADNRTTLDFTAGDIEFEAVGRRNVLGKPSVWVACRTKTPSDKYRTTARAVFCLLEAWSADRRTLYLQLPEEYFPEPGKIRIWFLREDDVVWAETVAWPGIGK